MTKAVLNFWFRTAFVTYLVGAPPILNGQLPVFIDIENEDLFFLAGGRIDIDQDIRAVVRLASKFPAEAFV